MLFTPPSDHCSAVIRSQALSALSEVLDRWRVPGKIQVIMARGIVYSWRGTIQKRLERAE